MASETTTASPQSVTSPKIVRKIKKKRVLKAPWTKSQEARYKLMVAKLEESGLTFRREELKRGHCWKVQSGVCRSQTERLFFLDSRLSPEDQLAFLESYLPARSL